MQGDRRVKHIGRYTSGERRALGRNRRKHHDMLRWLFIPLDSRTFKRLFA